jgi:soluble epoxide hydrolase/lipid-phosphate phosphatase
LAVPYHTLECGLTELVSTINTEIYPADKFPYGQWDYQAYYETKSAHVNKVFEADVENTIKAIYPRGDPASYGKPTQTSVVTRDGGRFGGMPSAPQMGDLIHSVLDEPTFNTLCTHLKRNGFFGPSCYYLNHAANEMYSKNAVNGGVLDVPALFIEAKYDGVCNTAVSNLSDAMRKYCRKLTECSIDAGHWVGLERPMEVNAAIAQWLIMNMPKYWPGY